MLSSLEAVRLLKGSCRDIKGRKGLGLSSGGTIFIHREGASLSLMCVNGQECTKEDGKRSLLGVGGEIISTVCKGRWEM